MISVPAEVGLGVSEEAAVMVEALAVLVVEVSEEEAREEIGKK